jgi:hypothetical protein
MPRTDTNERPPSSAQWQGETGTARDCKEKINWQEDALNNAKAIERDFKLFPRGPIRAASFSPFAQEYNRPVALFYSRAAFWRLTTKPGGHVVRARSSSTVFAVGEGGDEINKCMWSSKRISINAPWPSRAASAVDVNWIWWTNY